MTADQSRALQARFIAIKLHVDNTIEHLRRDPVPDVRMLLECDKLNASLGNLIEELDEHAKELDGPNAPLETPKPEPTPCARLCGRLAVQVVDSRHLCRECITESAQHEAGAFQPQPEDHA